MIPEGAPGLHEAAHAVAAAVLVGPAAIERVYLAESRAPRVIKMSELGSAPDTGALIWVDDPPLNEAVAGRSHPEDLSEDLRRRAHGRMIANIAGVYGADLAGGDLIAHPLEPTGGDADQAKSLAWLLAGWDEPAAETKIVEAKATAKAFVAEHEAAIRAVADALETRHELSGPDVAEFVGAARDPEP